MMAGFIIGIITVFVLSVKATHEPDLPPGIVNMASAITFSFALVLILFTNSELLTSNFMYFTVGLYYKVIKPTRVLKIFLLCFAGNILGAAIYLVSCVFKCNDARYVKSVISSYRA